MLSGGGAVPFFKEKLLVQWNDPTLTCFMENRSFMPEPGIVLLYFGIQVQGAFLSVAAAYRGIWGMSFYADMGGNGKVCFSLFYLYGAAFSHRMGIYGVAAEKGAADQKGNSEGGGTCLI